MQNSVSRERIARFQHQQDAWVASPGARPQADLAPPKTRLGLSPSERTLRLGCVAFNPTQQPGSRWDDASSGRYARAHDVPR